MAVSSKISTLKGVAIDATHTHTVEDRLAAVHDLRRIARDPAKKDVVVTALKDVFGSTREGIRGDGEALVFIATSVALDGIAFSSAMRRPWDSFADSS